MSALDSKPLSIFHCSAFAILDRTFPSDALDAEDLC